MYSPQLGRFLQTDPIGYYAGINLYTYVNNDPVNETDPLGLINPAGTVAKKAIKWVLKKAADKVATGTLKKVIEKILKKEFPPTSLEDILLEPTEIYEAGEGDYDNNRRPDFADDWDNDGILNMYDDSDNDGKWDYEDEDMLKKIDEKGKPKKK